MSQSGCRFAFVIVSFLLLTAHTAPASELVRNDPKQAAMEAEQRKANPPKRSDGTREDTPPECTTPICGDLQGVGFGVALGFAVSPEVNVTSTTVQNNVV